MTRQRYRWVDFVNTVAAGVFWTMRWVVRSSLLYEEKLTEVERLRRVYKRAEWGRLTGSDHLELAVVMGFVPPASAAYAAARKLQARLLR